MGEILKSKTIAKFLGTVSVIVLLSGCAEIAQTEKPETCATSYVQNLESCPITAKVFSTLVKMGYSDLDPTSTMKTVAGLCEDFWNDWNGNVGVPDGYFNGKLKTISGKEVSLTSNQAWYWLTFTIDSSDGVCLNGDIEPILTENKLSF